MNLIFGVLGTPQEDQGDYDFISNGKALDYIKGLKKKLKIPFSKIYPNATEQVMGWCVCLCVYIYMCMWGYCLEWFLCGSMYLYASIVIMDTGFRVCRRWI